MRFLRRALTGLFLLSLTVGLVALAAGGLRSALQERAARELPARTAQEQVYAAALAAFEPETVVPILETFGAVQSRRSLEVRASAPGRVVEIGPGVEEGGVVEAGQLLFRTDPVEAERARDVAEADLRDARVERDDAARAVELAGDDVENARDQAALRARALTRQRDIEGRGIGSAAAVETAELAEVAARQAVLSRRQALATAETRLANAETAIARAEIARDEAERSLGETRVEAAFDGVLSDLSLVEGGLLAQNERVADLIDPAALEVALIVSASEYARLAGPEGGLAVRDVVVRLEVGGYRIESAAEITRESAALIEGQTGRQLFARLDETAGFRPGDFVRVLIEEPALGDVARLPAGAVSSDGTVLVLGEDDRLSAAPVEVLRRQGDEVLVRADELAGRQVVAERSPLLGAGIRVRPLRVEQPEDDEREAAAPEMMEITDDRRAHLVALVEADAAIAAPARARMLAQLREPMVPAAMVARIEAGEGG